MHKIIAYFLLVVGLALMCFAFTGMYQTFVHKKPVVQVLQLKPLSIQTQYGTMQLDTQAISQIINLALFALFMAFLVVLGGKVFGAGSQLLKTERICETLQKLRREDVISNEKDIRKL